MIAAVKQRDIARKAGVTVATVSYALNGDRKIAEDTRQRIYQISRQLGYVNHRRIADRERQSLKRVALVFVYGDEPCGLPMDPLARGAFHQNLRLEIRYVKDKDDSSITASLLEIAVDCDALLLNGYVSRAVLKNLTAEGIRYVVLGPPLGGVRDLPSGSTVVACDMVDMGRAATRRLMALGHQRIGFVGTTRPAGMLQDSLLTGYQLAHLEAELPVDPKLTFITSEPLLEQVGSDPARWFARLPDAPTAFFAAHIAIFLDFAASAKSCGVPITPQSVCLGLTHSYGSATSLPEWPGVVDDLDALVEASFEQVRQVLHAPPSSARLVVVPFRCHLFQPAAVKPKE